MNGIVLTHEMKTSVTQALTQLIDRDTDRQSARTKQREILEEFRPQIVAARAKNRSWAKIAATMKLAGVAVSKTTLQRTFEPGRLAVNKSRTSTTRKSARKSPVNAPIKSVEIQPKMPVLGAEFTVPEIPVETAPEAVVTIRPEIVTEVPVEIMAAAPEQFEEKAQVAPPKSASLFGRAMEF